MTNRSLAERIELEGARHLPAPSWQFDRGRFENFLMEENVKAGVDVFQGAFITDVELGDPHVVTIVRGGPGGEESKVKARWLVDASGRAFILKRKLGLLEDNNHNVNSSWFRVAGGWTSRTGLPRTRRISGREFPSAASARTRPTTSAARATGCG